MHYLSTQVAGQYGRTSANLNLDSLCAAIYIVLRAYIITLLHALGGDAYARSLEVTRQYAGPNMKFLTIWGRAILTQFRVPIRTPQSLQLLRLGYHHLIPESLRPTKTVGLKSFLLFVFSSKIIITSDGNFYFFISETKKKWRVKTTRSKP